MKLTKEDYMKLGLEKCAELLTEMDEKQSVFVPYQSPITDELLEITMCYNTTYIEKGGLYDAFK